MNEKDTICAVATPQGNGAIAIIRLSGDKAIEICDKLFYAKNKKLIKQKANTIHHGYIKDKKYTVDEVLVSIYKSPHSYTGEDSVEISCHGSVYIQQEILKALIKNGARLAGPGEFTMRAFLNGKLDLSQAEAVADLIASSNKASHNVALNQMRGGFSSELHHLRNELLQFISLIELELDFSEEDFEFADRGKLSELINKIYKLITVLRDSFSMGNAIKNGVPVAIIGKPNVGKSTLLNALLMDEKAIVSEIAGTTRDAIEDTITLNGVQFRFIDTAGIRKTKDKLETIGIKKTFEKVQKAKIILYLFDADDKPDKIEEAMQELEGKINQENQKILIALNKIDKLNEEQLKKEIEHITSHLSYKNFSIVPIAAKSKLNLNVLEKELLSIVGLDRINEDQVIINNIRHFEALQKSAEALERAKTGLDTGISNDFLAQDIREVLHYLGEITGEITTDEILGNIFKNFCIGK